VSQEEQNRRQLKRILDANRNRALEALRVVEEHARFVLAADDLARRTKELRHRLHVALSKDELKDLALHRDVEHDPLHPEMPAPQSATVRATTEDVARANLSRAKEALRALEEYAKPLHAPAAGEVEKIRYAVYALESDLLAGSRARQLLADRHVYVLLEAKPGRPPLAALLRACIVGGARLFQYREKTAPDRARLEQARELVAIARAEGALLIVNDRPDLAALVQAHGVHVGRTDLPADAARRIAPPGALVGTSVHDAPELAAALAEKPDYLGIGTVFASPTKPELGAKGLGVLRELAPRAGLPVYAIGGITAANAASAIEAGAHGVAVSSAVLDAPDAAAAVRELVRVVGEERARVPGGRP
jgi:thiamine-phosphate pyrophosphorylase